MGGGNEVRCEKEIAICMPIVGCYLFPPERRNMFCGRNYDVVYAGIQSFRFRFFEFIQLDEIIWK